MHLLPEAHHVRHAHQVKLFQFFVPFFLTPLLQEHTAEKAHFSAVLVNWARIQVNSLISNFITFLFIFVPNFLVLEWNFCNVLTETFLLRQRRMHQLFGWLLCWLWCGKLQHMYCRKLVSSRYDVTMYRDSLFTHSLTHSFTLILN